ncbi:lasso RiPP family leader peptide-containing protein [Streptomyces sp. NPDC059788]
MLITDEEFEYEAPELVTVGEFGELTLGAIGSYTDMVGGQLADGW